MRKIICNTILLGAFLISTQSKAQHLLEALDASGFYSTQTKSYSRSFTKNNCSTGYTGSSVTYTQTATATANSQISQADADSKASTAATAEAQRLVNEGGQAYANTNGTCDIAFVPRRTCESMGYSTNPPRTSQQYITGNWFRVGSCSGGRQLWARDVEFREWGYSYTGVTDENGQSCTMYTDHTITVRRDAEYRDCN